LFEGKSDKSVDGTEKSKEEFSSKYIRFKFCQIFVNLLENGGKF